ncbi:MAG: tetratricopeptide repeat protein [Deltaproteobacteria bacterium]|nr:tetratricopeptide repeat protein [Deltaproteobacteria bacterium]
MTSFIDKELWGVIALVAALAAGCGAAQPGGSDSVGGAEGSKEQAGPPAAELEAKARMESAGSAIADGNTQGAYDEYSEAARVLDEANLVVIDRAEAHFYAADLAYKLLDKDGAITHYKAAIDVYLRFSGNSKVKAAIALNNLGAIYKEIGDKPAARSAWEQAMQVYREAPPELQNQANMAKIEQNISDLREGF